MSFMDQSIQGALSRTRTRTALRRVLSVVHCCVTRHTQSCRVVDQRGFQTALFDLVLYVLVRYLRCRTHVAFEFRRSLPVSMC